MHGGSDVGKWCENPSKCIRLQAVLKFATIEAGGRLVLTPQDVAEMCTQHDLIVRECGDGIEAVTTPRYPAV